MGQYYVKVGGTRASGFSTLDDWTNANCYGTLNSAVNQAWTTADEIVLNDEAHSVTSLQTGVSSAATGNRLNIRSKSGDPSLCSVTSTSATATALSLNHATKAYTSAISGISWIKSGTFTHTASPSLLSITSMHGDASFTDCIFGPSVLTDASSTSRAQAHIGTNAATRTITMTRVVITGLDSTLLGGKSLGLINTDNTLILDDCDINSTSVSITADNNHYGGFYIDGGTLDIRNSRVNGSTFTHVGTSDAQLHEAMFVTNPTATMLVDGLTATNMVATGSTAGAFLLSAEGSYTVSNLNVSDSYSRSYDYNNCHGGIFLATGDTAQGTLDGIIAENVRATFGTVVYCAQGGGGVFTDIVARNCEAYAEGILYAGGWGDVTFDDFHILGAVAGTDPAIGDAGYACAVYAHNHTSATRNKTTVISNGDILGCVQKLGGEGGIRVRGQVVGYAHDVEITNMNIDNPGHVLQITLVEIAGCVLNLVTSNVAVRDGMQGVDSSRIAGDGTNNYSVTDISASQIVRGVPGSGSVSRLAA